MTNIDITTLKAEVKYRTILTTTVCVEPINLTVKLLYNINNVQITITKPYVVNTTDNFILSLLQPNSTVSYTIQVINTAGNIVGSATTARFILPAIMPSITGITKIMNENYEFICLIITGRISTVVSTPYANECVHRGIYVYFIIL